MLCHDVFGQVHVLCVDVVNEADACGLLKVIRRPCSAVAAFGLGGARCPTWHCHMLLCRRIQP